MSQKGINSRKIISELRTKDQKDILTEVLENVQSDEDVESLRPDISGENLNEDTYSFPTDQELPLMVKIDRGKKQYYNIALLRIANLINNGISPNIGIFGKSQRGKSETALWMLHALHSEDHLNLLRGDFNPQNQVIYDVIPFLLFWRYSGRVGCYFEEAGETVNKNNYNSKMNKAVAGVLNTQGKKQIPNFFVTPEASRLDPRVRENIDVEIELTSTGTAEVTFYERIYGKKAETRARNWNFGKVNGKWSVPRAPKHLRSEYDKIDSSFKGRYLDDLLVDALSEKLEEQQQDEVMEF